MPNPSEALTKPDLGQKSVVRTLAPRPGNAPSGITALAEPYMLTIQAGERSMRIEDGEGGSKGLKKASKARDRPKHLQQSRRGRFLGQAQSGDGSSS